MCLLSCQIYCTYETWKHCALQQRRKAMYKYIDLTVEAYKEYFEISFFRWGILLNSIMCINCSTGDGEADQNQMAVDVRERLVKSFHFADVIKDRALCDNSSRLECRNRNHVLNPEVVLDPRSGSTLLACGSVKGFCFLTNLNMHLGI